MLRLLSSIGILFSLVITPVSFATDLTCNDTLTDRVMTPAKLKTTITKLADQYSHSLDFRQVQMKLAMAYSTLITDTASFAAFNELIPASMVLDIIENHEMRLYQLRLTAVIEQLNAKKGAALSSRNVKSFFAKTLENIVTSATIEGRVNAFIESKGQSLEAVKQVLGEIEADELKILVHGGDPLHPTPESLIGQYIQQTGATTIEHRFPTTAKVDEEYKTFGEPKLVVSLSAQSAKVYQKLFTRPEFLIHTHTPNQGTLYLAHDGFVGSYMRFSSIYSPSQSPGSILPHILLPSQEANRMLLIAELGYRAGDLRESWRVCEGYSPKGGYSSCTHWSGNLPIGRTIVRDAKHPGKVDQYANNDVPAENQIGPFGEYDAASRATRWNKMIGGGRYGTRWLKALMPLVWRNDGQGANMSLSEMFGPAETEANFKGEYANPGYVAHRLTGNVSNEFVPVVFRVVADHKVAIEPNFDEQIHAY